MNLLFIDQANQKAAMVIYALLPSSLLLTSVTLREAYQLLFINLAIYAFLKIYSQNSLFHYFVLLVAIASIGMLHGGLYAFGIILITSVIIIQSLRGSAHHVLRKLILALPVLVALVFYGLYYFNSLSYGLDKDIGDASEIYQEKIIVADGRTTYLSNGSTGPLTMASSFLQYLFEPMPWRNLALVDYESLIENLIRLWLIYRAVMVIHMLSGERKRFICFNFIMYLILEFIWSLGTANWGTAIRHHIPSLGLLIIPAFATSLRTSNRSSQDALMVKGA